MKRHETLPLGVVLERRKIDHPWKEYVWQAVGVFAGAAALDPRGEWRLLRRDEERERYHAGTLPLDLYRSETEGYKLNLSQKPPRVFVIVRYCEGGKPHELQPFKVTACPYEAEEYLDGGDDLVEAVAMPDAVLGLVRDFIAEHHVEQAFQKRKRKRFDPQRATHHGALEGAPAPASSRDRTPKGSDHG